MKKLWVKQMMTLATAASMVLAVPTPVSAKEVVQKNMSTSVKTELDTCVKDNGKLMKQITVLQNDLKEEGVLTSENSDTLKEMSAAIQKTRQNLTEKRNAVTELIGEKEKPDKEQMKEVQTLQQEQLELQQELSGLLTDKLNYLISFTQEEAM